jgi:hypothetical protein
LATKKKAKKSNPATKKAAKSTKKKAKVKKGGEYTCGLCGNVVTIETVEDLDGIYGYVREDAIICCGEVMKEK